MPSSYGKHMMSAMRSISEMQDDCIRIFHSLDKELSTYSRVYGNVVTLDLVSPLRGEAILLKCFFAITRPKTDPRACWASTSAFRLE